MRPNKRSTLNAHVFLLRCAAMQISPKQFLSFVVNSKSSCRLRLVVRFYLCYSQGRKTCLSAAKTKHPVCIPKGKHTENFSNDLRHDKQNANAYLIKCATFPYCDQFRVPCLNTKLAYMQLFCPVTRLLKFREDKSFNICMLRSESLRMRLCRSCLSKLASCFCISNGKP